MKTPILRLIFIVSLLMGEVGCVAPSQSAVANANYGSCPDNYQEIIKGYWARRLFDPYSAVYEFGNPCKAWTTHGGRLTKINYGYAIPVTLNAKNQFGGYTGIQSYYFFFVPNGQFYVIDGRGLANGTDFINFVN